MILDSDLDEIIRHDTEAADAGVLFDRIILIPKKQPCILIEGQWFFPGLIDWGKLVPVVAAYGKISWPAQLKALGGRCFHRNPYDGMWEPCAPPWAAEEATDNYEIRLRPEAVTPAEPKLCTCSTMDLMAYGCKCGAVEPYKARF